MPLFPCLRQLSLSIRAVTVLVSKTRLMKRSNSTTVLCNTQWHLQLLCSIRRTRFSRCDQAALASTASRPAQDARPLPEQHSMCQICLNLLTWSKTSEGIRLRQASHHTHMASASLMPPACRASIWQPEVHRCTARCLMDCRMRWKALCRDALGGLRHPRKISCTSAQAPARANALKRALRMVIEDGP